MFNEQELQNILALINRCDLKGQEAMTVAVLQQKIASLIKPAEKKDEGKGKSQ